MKKILFSILCLVLFSCSNTESEDNQNVPVGFLKKIMISEMGDNSTEKLFYNGNKIEKIETDENRNIFIYSGDLIVEINKYDFSSVLISKTSFQYDTNNNLISSLILNYIQNIGVKSMFTNENDGTVLKKYFTGDLISQNSLSGFVKLYFENNEVIKSEYTNNNTVVISNYENDSANNPMNQIIGFSKLNLALNYPNSFIGALPVGNLGICNKIVNEDSNADCPTVAYNISKNSINYPVSITTDETLNSCQDLPSYYYSYQ